jgi:hypothetical protein
MQMAISNLNDNILLRLCEEKSIVEVIQYKRDKYDSE